MTIAQLALYVFVAVVALALLHISSGLGNLIGGIAGLVYIVASLIGRRA